MQIDQHPGGDGGDQHRHRVLPLRHLLIERAQLSRETTEVVGLQQQPLDPDLPQVGFNDTPQLFRASGSGPAVSRESFKVTCVTSRPAESNSLLPASGLLESAGANPSFTDLDRWMVRQQRGDPETPGTIVVAVSPSLLRFFSSQVAIREQADDLLQETWLRIHRVQPVYRPNEPVLP